MVNDESANNVTSAVLDLSLLGGTSDTAARSTPFHWVDHYTSNHMPSAVQVRHTSTATVITTGKRAWTRRTLLTS